MNIFALLLLVPMVKFLDLTGRYFVAAAVFTVTMSTADFLFLMVGGSLLHAALRAVIRFVLSTIYFYALDTIAEGFWWWIVMLFGGAVICCI